MEIKYTEKYEWNTHTKKCKTYYSYIIIIF